MQRKPAAVLLISSLAALYGSEANGQQPHLTRHCHFTDVEWVCPRPPPPRCPKGKEDFYNGEPVYFNTTFENEKEYDVTFWQEVIFYRPDGSRQFSWDFREFTLGPGDWWCGYVFIQDYPIHVGRWRIEHRIRERVRGETGPWITMGHTYFKVKESCAG